MENLRYRATIIAAALVLVLAACDSTNSAPPAPPVTEPADPPPSTPEDPVDPGELFDVLDQAWSIEIPQGHANIYVPPTTYINDDGVLFFGGNYFPGQENCEPGTLPEECQHSRAWTINPDGTIRGIYDVKLEGVSRAAAYIHSTLPGPNGDAYVVGAFGYPARGFMQRINADGQAIGEPVTTPVLHHLTTSSDHTMVFDITATHSSSIVRATRLHPRTGSTTLMWETTVSDYYIPRYVAYNNGEVHVLVSERQLKPSVHPTEFIALDADTGEILHKTVMPRSAPSEPGNEVMETPYSLVVNTAGETLMYMFTMEQPPTGHARLPKHITEIRYDPAARTFQHAEIEFLDEINYYPDQHLHPVAMPTGEVLLTANTHMGFVLLAVKDSKIQWVHDLHPGGKDPEHYEPFGLTYHPAYGYYVLGSHRDGGLPLREGLYQIKRFTGIKDEAE